MDPSSRSFRFLILILNCFLTFGSYYVFDMPSVLEQDLETELAISDTEYQLFYSLYGWTNCVMSLCAGIIVDRYGYRLSAFLFLTMIVLGQLVFAMGYSLPVDKKSKFGIMLVGRFLFGIGGGSITIVQNTISAHWFKGKELAVAFGVTLTMSRLGSVLNFFTTKELRTKTSLAFTLWFGAGCCFIGVVSAIILSALDKFAERRLGSKYTGSGKVVKLADIRKFQPRYWALVFAICFFYLCIFPFISTAPKMFREQHHYSEDSRIPSYMSSTVYFLSILLSIPMGRIVDTFGRQCYWILFAACITPSVFLLFAFTNILPVYPMLILGLAYTIMAASLWPSIPLVIPLGTVGTAMGIATSVQMIGVGATSLIVGAIQDSHYHYNGSDIFFASLGCVVIGIAFILLTIDKRTDGMLTKSKKEQMAALKAATDANKAPEEVVLLKESRDE